jgi:hypothetical protein
MALGFNGFLNKTLFARLGWIIFLRTNGLELDKGPTTSVLFTISFSFFLVRLLFKILIASFFSFSFLNGDFYRF